MRGLIARSLVLAGILVVGAACSDDPEPVFEVQGSGSVEGLIFFDADKNGSFDPSAGDLPLPNVGVKVVSRGTQATLANGIGTTDATGRFTLTNLAPGSHSLVVDTATAGGVKFCLNPLPLSVFISERQFVKVGGQEACIISIAEAEQLRNQVVVVQGIITSKPDDIRSSYTYIQDETGGIRIFSSALSGKGLAIGDRIEVTGTIADFSADLQISGTVTLGAVEKNVTIIPPKLTTTGALQSLSGNPSAEDLGILVEIKKARIETVFGPTSTVNGRNTFIDDGSGRMQIRFEAAAFPAASTDDAKAQLTALYPVGKCYDIVGVTGAFNTDIQIFPRTLADIKEVPCS